MKDMLFEFDKSSYQETIQSAFIEFESAIKDNKIKGIDFDIYPDIKWTGIDKLMKHA